MRAVTESLASELQTLRAAAVAGQAQLQAARADADAQARDLLGIVAAEQKAREERELWEALASEAEANRQADRAALEQTQRAFEALQKRYETEIATLQTKAEQAPADQQAALMSQASQAAAAVDLDEAATRALIDQQLRDAGWDADTKALRYPDGARPQKGKYWAIAEWPTDAGPADYVLFDGLMAIAVVEAKKARKDVPAALEQAKHYSRGFLEADGAQLPGGPWGEYRVPFVFSTNGRPYLKQFETKSGIWFCDLRRPQYAAAFSTSRCSGGPRDAVTK